MRKRKQTIKLNNSESLQGLMQEVYNDACSSINDVQNTINELGLAYLPETADDLSKIMKEKINALKVKDSAMRVKLEVGKLMNDVIKHNGNIEEMNESRIISGAGPTTDDFKDIRNWVKNNPSLRQ